MPDTPERPFVPRRTPTKAQPAIASTDFSVSRPFVPGAERERIESFRAELDTERESDVIPSIASFLDSTPRGSSAIAPDRDDEAYADELDRDDQELPPVEHFTDPLPAVGEYAPETATAGTGDAENSGAGTAGAAQAEWIETDWQQYDWRAAAALGDSGENEASSAWADTDWEAAGPQTKETKPSAANAIASALDQIAQKIRDGELALPNPGTVTDPRTIASTLAALLGIRQ